MFRKWLWLAIIVQALLIGSAGSGLAGKVYINGIDANYPPFTFINAKGEPDGLDVKAVNWIAEEMGFEVKHQPTEWDAIIPSLRKKKIDFIASGMTVTEERKEAVNFTIPYNETIMVLVAGKDSDLTVEQAMQSGVRWGVQRGTSEAKWIEDNLLQKGKEFELVHYDSAPLAMEDIVNGRIDCAAVSTTSANEIMDKGVPVKILGKYGQPDDTVAYAVRKEDTELLNMLNKGLKRLMATDYWQELNEKYKLK
ncbi:MAG: ABC transporter substrate-binding protein [Desulfohalobiaceae bacterium]|nr:ABC transporter substrate-binding protein [Desulfohalobiaceae bacterium]